MATRAATYVWIAGVVLTMAPWAAQGSLVITSPSAGDEWTAGSEVVVRWDAGVYPYPLAAVYVLVRDGVDGPGALVGLMSSVEGAVFPVEAEEARFVLPTWMGDGADYHVQLMVIEGAGIMSLVEPVGPITIAGSTAMHRVECTSPMPGETWQAGSTHTITWNNQGPQRVLRMGLNKPSDGPSATFGMAEMFTTDGQYEWTIPPGIAAGTGYRLMMFAMSLNPMPARRPIPFDLSPQLTIQTDGLAPTLELVSPLPGEVYSAGAPVEIAWSTDLVGVEVVALVWQAGRRHTFSISSDVDASEGRMTWWPCAYLDADNLSIELLAYLDDGLAVSDRTDGTFSVEPIASGPTVELLAPPDAASYVAGDRVPVIWEVEGCGTCRHVSPRINAMTPDGLLPVSNGHYWISDHQVDWLACPRLGEEIESYDLRACTWSPDCLSVCSESVQIELEPTHPDASVEVTAPVATSRWLEGSTQTITWSAEHAEGLTAEIMQTTMDGRDGNQIEQVGAWRGSYEWTVVANWGFERTNRILIRLRDENCAVAEARSAFFEIELLPCNCGDVDADGAVDLADYGLMASCWGRWPEYGVGCRCSDFNGDRKIDLRDFAIYQNMFGGGSSILVPACE